MCCCPIGHVVQLVAAAADRVLPVQEVQESTTSRGDVAAFALVFWNVPAGHVTHTEWSAFVTQPGAHVVQVSLPRRAAARGGHCVQTVLPQPAAAKPALHSVQVVAAGVPAAEPGGHRPHADMWVTAAYDPAPHGVHVVSAGAAW